MFISDLSLLIENYEALQIENRILKQELKKIKKLENNKDKKTKKKEKTTLKKENLPSLF